MKYVGERTRFDSLRQMGMFSQEKWLPRAWGWLCVALISSDKAGIRAVWEGPKLGAGWARDLNTIFLTETAATGPRTGEGVP